MGQFKGRRAQDKAQRRSEAAARQAEHDKLSVKEKLAKLDAAGHAAVKERARLATLAKKGE
jgi:hypothetical protein